MNKFLLFNVAMKLLHDLAKIQRLTDQPTTSQPTNLN